MVIFNMISVHKDFGGRGIGRKLVQRSEDYLRTDQKQIRLLSAETTGALSAKVFGKQGFEQITKIIYDEYRDHNEKPVFKEINLPHTECIVWAKLI